MILGSGVSLGLFWLTEIPLGVPGEWNWRRHAVTPDLVATGLTCLISGAVYLTIIAWGYRRLSRDECSGNESRGWQLALAVMAGVWIWTVQGTGTTGATVGRWPFILYYPASSGYFFKARYEAPDAREFLRNYESLISEGDVLHVGTHPPGLFLCFHGLIELVNDHPAWVPLVNKTQPRGAREAFDVIHDNSVRAFRSRQSVAPPLTPEDRCVLWLAALICFGCAAITVWPLFGFLRQYVDRPTSWLCAALWPLVPAASVFLPKSDAAFALPAMLLGWLWLRAWKQQSIWLASLAGVVWSVSILCSLAFLPVALWLALLSLMESWPALRTGSRQPELRRALRTILPAGLASLFLMTALSIWGEIPLWKTFWLNYQNHAGFYAQYPRTYLAWLAVNPLELAYAMGFPLFLTAMAGILSALRDRGKTAAGRLMPPCVATGIVCLWLWLSGKNSGEAARLWIFLMPYLVVCSAAVWRSVATVSPKRRLPWTVLCWIGCQALVCFWTVQRINGFSLE